MKTLYIIIFLFSSLSAYSSSYINNPFKNNYGSQLNYNRFKMFNQFSVFSVNSSHYSHSFGSYLNTIQYDVNNNISAFLHLGKKFDFNKKNSLDLSHEKNFLRGGTVVYKFKYDFTLGIEYGTTPDNINSFSNPLLINTLHNEFNYYNFVDSNKNLSLWLNKNFNNHQFNVNIQYHQIESYRQY